MSVLENFKNITRSPYGGRQGLNVIFFPSNLQRNPWIKKRGGLSPPQRATGPCRPPLGRPTSGPSLQVPGGPVAPPAGDRGPPRATGSGRLYKASPHSLLSFDLKKSKKIQKKERDEKKGSGEALPNSALVIYR